MEASFVERFLAAAVRNSSGRLSRVLEEGWSFFFVNRQQVLRAERR